MVSQISGLVLAGGRSRRMGSDKALVTVDGVPLHERQRATLATAGASEVFLSARPEQAWASPAMRYSAILHDAFPDCGPLGGICAGLERMSGSHLLVAAVDLPRLPSTWFVQLLRASEDGVGCVGVRDDHFEPLAAVYPRNLKWSAMERLARGEYSLQPLLKAAVEQRLMHPVTITPEQRAWFENWNEPRDRGDAPPP